MDVLERVLTVDTRKAVPERFLIAARALVFHHCAGALPHRLDQLIRIVAMSCQLPTKQLEVSVGKNILIHRQQRAVQIKQYLFQNTIHLCQMN